MGLGQETVNFLYYFLTILQKKTRPDRLMDNECGFSVVAGMAMLES
jgi:hypothetical protein